MIISKELADHLHTHLSFLSLLHSLRAWARVVPPLSPILFL